MAHADGRPCCASTAVVVPAVAVPVGDALLPMKGRHDGSPATRVQVGGSAGGNRQTKTRCPLRCFAPSSSPLLTSPLG